MGGGQILRTIGHSDFLQKTRDQSHRPKTGRGGGGSQVILRNYRSDNLSLIKLQCYFDFVTRSRPITQP